jgi:hypothetical protein
LLVDASASCDVQPIPLSPLSLNERARPSIVLDRGHENQNMVNQVLTRIPQMTR